MNTELIAPIRASFARIEPIAEAVGMAFYEHLFTINPALRTRFHEDLSTQSRKLMTMLGTVVAALDQPGKLEHLARTLGERHCHYGVEDPDYDDVGAALIQTLRECLGDDFDETLESAWATIYGFLAERMIAATCTARSASAA